jgi:hypothetical protein
MQLASEVHEVGHAVALKHTNGEHDEAAEMQEPRPLQLYFVSVVPAQLSVAHDVPLEYRLHAPEPLQKPS